MDATRGAATATTQASALLAAALALPGVASPALGQTAPDHGVISLNYLDYRDWQPGEKRMTVRSPSFYLLAPLSDHLAMEGSATYDSMSGASPFFHNTLSGASIGDYRSAGDIKLTKYFDRMAIGAGAAYSREQDYISRTLSLDVRIASDDRNRTYALGISATSDRINSINGVAEDRHRRSVEILLGVTQALSENDIVQSNLTSSDGRGYFSDPYKVPDERPDRRRVWAWLTRYRHHLDHPDATLALAYRYLSDSFGGKAHYLEAAWIQALPAQWTVTPSLRYYTQSAARFYRDPPFPAGFVAGQPYTADTRLSAFGAMTAGLGVAKVLADGWSISSSAAFYRQRSGWRLGGGGSRGLEPFSARWFQTGISKTF